MAVSPRQRVAVVPGTLVLRLLLVLRLPDPRPAPWPLPVLLPPLLPPAGQLSSSSRSDKVAHAVSSPSLCPTGGRPATG